MHTKGQAQDHQKFTHKPNNRSKKENYYRNKERIERPQPRPSKKKTKTPNRPLHKLNTCNQFEKVFSLGIESVNPLSMAV